MTGAAGTTVAAPEFRPYIPFYRQRWREPAKAAPQDAFVRALPGKS